MSKGINSKAWHARGAAYSSEVRPLLTASPFERASAPLGPRSFSRRLQRKHKARCQRVLTADGKKQAHGHGHGHEKHTLERAKRAVGLEHVAESDKATHVASEADVVLGETMGQKASTVSGY